MALASAVPHMTIRDEVATLKRERTISVAVDLFYERGYEGTSLDAVAERMSVTKPFIYAHFSSKAELLAEICSRGIASSLDAINSVLPLPGTPSERLAEVARRFVRAVLDNQRHIAIFSREEKNLMEADYQRISQMRRDFDSRLVKLLDEGVKAGDLKLPDTAIAALAIGGMVSWAYVWFRPNGRLTLEQISDELSRLIMQLAGAAAPPPRARAKLAPAGNTKPRAVRR